MRNANRVAKPTHVHWTVNNPKHSLPACGAASYRVSHRTDLVTCPRCKNRRDFKAAVAAVAT